jgi:hypothetical protein
MKNLEVKYIGIILVETINTKEVMATKDMFLSDIIEDCYISNKYVLAGNISIPEGTILLPSHN